MTGIESIAAERQRQIDEEGFSPEHDDMYDAGELAEAAACYAACANTYFPDPPAEWPFDDSWWKQSTARRDLVKAGALIAAEIDRLDREAERQAARTSPAPEELKPTLLATAKLEHAVREARKGKEIPDA